MSVVLPLRVKKEILEKINELLESGYGKSRNEVIIKLIELGLKNLDNENEKIERIVKEGKISLGKKKDWVSEFLGERE
ncbi:CopG family transcriptional regulator [Ignicoccus pacificus DSM 13166]|uniref:CopG family transcriptional regulator n=1 Tax=Ignicoccus pacificus DSM 13166 TaxID=940294 RepID=A0A977PJK0_9CREN|nr:CopG family transcriptional regulator [Ignicoccus pacificus DSM 13166]